MSFHAKAQVWEKIIDLGGYEEVLATEITMDGGLIIGGEQFDLNHDSSRAFVIRTDLDGDIIWEKYFLNTNYEYSSVEKIAAHSDGGFVTAIISSLTGSNADLFIRKLNEFGEVEWEYTELFSSGNITIANLMETQDGGVSIYGRFSDINEVNEYTLKKLDAQGNLVYEKVTTDSDLTYFYTFDALLKDNGNTVVAGAATKFDTVFHWLLYVAEHDALGNLVWSKYYPAPTNTWITDIKKAANGGYALAGRMMNSNGNSDGLLMLVDETGDMQWQKLYGGNNIESFSAVHALQDGTFMMAGLTNSFGNGDSEGYMLGADENGEATFVQRFGNSKNDQFKGIFPTGNGGYLLVGEIGQIDVFYKSEDIYLVKMDSISTTFNNQVTGYIFNDDNLDCVKTTDENGINNWIITAESSNYFLATTSDTNGYYSFTLDTGSYVITAYQPSNYWEFCNNPVPVNFQQANSNLSLDFPMSTSVECPYLEVSVSTFLLRRCSTATYSVQYCNNGTVGAEEAYVEIDLDSFLIFQNSSIPLVAQNGNILTFDLGDVNVFDCGSFTIDVLADCNAELGQTHCVEAHIYPDSLCVPTSGWSGGSIEVNGFCVDDTIHFSIKNKGNTTLSPGLEYIVIEDDVILYQGNINMLLPGQVQEVSIENVGATYRLETDQEPNHPGNSMPTFVIEGCGQGFTPGFVNQFPMDDADPFIDIDCRENIGSYDPNDKQAFPIGYDDEHFIEQNIDLEYFIRFQNTGTDTAFRVVIRDTLSPFLDVASVRPGASSHNYDFDISGPGILKFTFENILLPDSTTNESASQGFIKYRISQKENVPLGSVINNSAAIYFDFNAPVITNTTFHTIGEDFVPMNVSVNSEISENILVNVFPNPFSKKAILELNGVDLKGEKTFLLFNSTGQLMQKFIFENDRIEINGEELNNGVYYFKINNKQGVAVTGKVVVME